LDFWCIALKMRSLPYADASGFLANASRGFLA
jgi:hypothetical protein